MSSVECCSHLYHARTELAEFIHILIYIVIVHTVISIYRITTEMFLKNGNGTILYFTKLAKNLSTEKS